METALKSQLNKLKLSQKSQPVLPNRSEASFLFDLQHSKRIDLDTIYELGYSGLIDLARHRQIFVKYFNSIFNSTSKYFNRETKRGDELKQYDESLKELIVQLIPYFRHKSTHKILEYLIRIYNVNVHNKKILLFAFLPYHETKFFAKLIQIINFDQFNHLKFFSTFGKEGKVVLKEFLYKELSANFDLLREIFSFYDECVLTNNKIELDDSIYFNFIFDICEYLLRNKSKSVSIDVNRLNLIIQFLNRIFKFFKSKISLFNRASYEDDGEYETSLVTNTCKLINTLVTKLSISEEYKIAFANDLINKLLVFVFEETSIENIIRTIFIIMNETESSKKNQKEFVIRLGKETLINLEEIHSSKRNFRQILRNISEQYDVALLIKTILLSNHENINLIKTLIRDNDFKEDNLKRLIVYLYNHIIENNNEEYKSFTEILNFIEEIHSEKFNSILINLFTNTKDKDYVKKIQEITSKINNDYQKLLKDNSADVEVNTNQINAFNLFLNLNNTNINTVINSIRKIDDIYLLDDVERKEYLMRKIVPSLANKFVFFDEEIILNEIVSLNHISHLINNYSLFRKDFVNFFFSVCEKHIDFYSPEFISFYVDVLELHCINEKDPLGFKALVYLILFKFEKETLHTENNFIKNLFNGDSDYSKFVDYLCSNQNENMNSIRFFEITRDLLKNMTLHKNSNFDSKLLLMIMEKILIKEKEKMSLSKNTFYRLLDLVIEILNSDNIKIQKYNELFKSLSGIFIIIIDSVAEISAVYASDNEVRKIIDNYARILMTTNNISDFDRLNKLVFLNAQNIQKFLTYLILNTDTLNEMFYVYIRNNIASWESAEICFITALIYAISYSIDSKAVNTILEILNQLNNKKLNSSNFNKFSVDYQICLENEVDNKKSLAYGELVDDLLSRKNEIIVNRGNIKKFISSLMNEEAFETIFSIFLKNADSTNLKSISKILELFSFSKKDKYSPHTGQSQILNLCLIFVTELSSNSKILTNDINRNSFIQLTQLIFENLLNVYRKSDLKIIQVLLTISNEYKFDQKFVERFFEKDNFEITEEIKENQHQLYKIIKFALAYSIPAESFVTNDNQFCKDLLKYIINEKIILNRENEFFIIYSFEIILKSKNYYFDLNYVKLTTDVLETLQKQEQTNSESNTVYLNLSNNLLTIISNSTIESEEKKELKPIINKLEQIIFHLVHKFRNFEIEMSQSLELAHVMNTLFLSINKLISQFDFIHEEREYVKNLIVRCLEILNVKRDNENGEDVIMTDLTQKTKEEVYLVFLNAIRNFIELIFTKQNSSGRKDEIDKNIIFYEYIHYFVKFSIMNIKDEKVLEMFLSNFIQIPLILSNENFLACYFVNLFYFTIDLNTKKLEKNFYSQIILNFFKQDEDESKIKIHMLRSLKIISSIFEELNRNMKEIFCLQSEDIKTRPDPNFISLNLISKIFILTGDNFGHLENSNDPDLLNTILKICNSINKNRKITTAKMRKNENSVVNNEIYKLHLKELKSFEQELFSTLNESQIIYNAILLIYQIYNEDSQRGYLFNKFNEIIITKENLSSVNVPSLFEFFVKSLRKEDKVENLQLIFSILTKITLTDDHESKEILRILRTDDNLDYIISLVKFSQQNENNKNLQLHFYHFSILVFLSKVFNILPPNKFLDKFNQFIKIFIQGFSVVLGIQNEDLTILILETFCNLSQFKSEFLSPYLNEILYKILLITDKSVNESNFIKIQSIVNTTFEIIAKKQLFDISFKSVKYCIKNLSGDVGVETFKIIFNYFKTSIEQTDKVVVADMYEKIFKFFVKILIDEKLNGRLAENILDCLKTLILKINEKQLRTIFQNILIFGKEKSEGETSLKYKLENSIVSFQILNTILKSISIVFVPYFEKYKGYWTDLTNSVCSLFSSEDKRNSNKKKKSRIEFDEAYDNQIKTFSYLKLNSLLLENIKLNFKYNKENYLLNETIEDLFDSLSAELKFIFFESEEEKYLKYFDEEIKISFIEIFRNLKSDDHLKEFNDSIMNLIREDHYLIKLLALKMIFSLFQELKERYITLLSNILPYVSDCLEDSNEKVHAEAFKIMKYIEKETGEDLKYYLEG